MSELSSDEIVVLRQLGQRVEEWNEDYQYITALGDLHRQLAALRRLRADVLQYAPYLESENNYDYVLLHNPLNSGDNDKLPGAGLFQWEDNIMFGHANQTLFMPRAVVCRIFFWCKLNYNMRRLEQRIGYLSVDLPPTDKPVAAEPATTATMPHFGLDDRCEGHWADVYHRLCAMGCFDSREVSSGDFRYICCGCGEPPAEPLLWRGRVNVLAYIIRRHMGHRWATARACFRLKDKQLPSSFENTQPPKVQKVCDRIDMIFEKH